MKIPSSSLLSTLAVLVAAPHASADQSGDFTYTDNGTSITITDYPTAAIGAVVIPDAIAGKPVTTIGALAFFNCGLITSVSIPASVTTIDDQAFVNCFDITTVNIPNGITRIGYNTFAGCYDLNGVTIPSSVTYIDDSAFSFCKSLTSIVIPPTVTGMGHSVFYGCSALTSIKLSPSVTDIKQFQFYGCAALTGIDIPASVTGIGNSAFKACSLMEEVNFKGNAPSLGLESFAANASGFHINFYNGATGFTTPTWNGFNAFNIGDIPVPEIAIAQPAGTNLADGSSSRDFGNVTLGANAKLTFTITNPGTDDLTGIALTVTGLQAADYRVTGPANATLAPSGSATFEVTFSPSALGARAAEIQVASNDADENPFNIALSGTGTAVPVPEIAVSQPATSHLADGITKRSFGTEKVGVKGKAKTFTIENKGTAALTGISLKTSGKNAGDFLIEDPAVESLAPGGTTTFKVRFKPKAKGTRNAGIQIKSNDSDENPFDIRVAGEGTRK